MPHVTCIGQMHFSQQDGVVTALSGKANLGFKEAGLDPNLDKMNGQHQPQHGSNSWTREVRAGI